MVLPDMDDRMEHLIDLDASVSAALRDHELVTHALAYGSFTQGTADAFSDLEYYAYLAPEDVPGFDPRAFLAGITPVLHFVVNDFGVPNVVTTGLTRIELHVEAQGRIEDVLSWPGEHVHPERMLVKDTDGRLTDVLARLAAKVRHDPLAEAQVVVDRVLNWLVFGVGVLARGERVRALELLWWVRGGLLRLARLMEGETTHWLNPSRRAELELLPGALAWYARTTGTLDELKRQYREAWAWLRTLVKDLSARTEIVWPEALARDLEVRLEGQ